MEIIRVENLHKNFGKLEVLKGINFSARKGEVITIIGPSGSGKSTLLRCMNGLEEADEGQVITDARIGMVFQNFNLFPPASPLRSNDFRWYWNLNQLSIAYGSRPRLRSRLTLSGRTFLRKP
jgi:ABC-type histidine transport system ATPase subunit